jgi:hypothetical protein
MVVTVTCPRAAVLCGNAGPGPARTSVPLLVDRLKHRNATEVWNSEPSPNLVGLEASPSLFLVVRVKEYYELFREELKLKSGSEQSQTDRPL